MEENTDLKTKLEELEKKNKTNTTILIAENVELKTDLFRIICNFSPTIETYSDEENYIGSVDPNIISFETDLDNTPKQVVNITFVTSNPSEIEKSSEFASSICTETKLLEDREVDEFLDSTYKEKISNKIRERNWEKKFRSQDLSLDNILQSNKNKHGNGNVDRDVTSTTPNETKCQPRNANFTVLYKKLCDAIILADHKTQEAIMYYCLFGKALIQRRNEIASEKQVERIEKAKKFYKLFDTIDNVSFDYSIQIELHSNEKNPEHTIQLCEPSSRSDNENFSDLKVEISIPTISQSKKNLLETEEGSFPEKVSLEKLSETETYNI
ncbi:hypothetical protein C2G38_2167097 [Gigaspora rosea]|uniref:Uncharacterized protein n=1 Tax=Gigaspora rosea TaxID=44941 RepID=A0A397VY88_9GLOM|nr:hypothetical protein C2G38_2167097 [Gigaspora rosea]